jgi:hypothetical protein
MSLIPEFDLRMARKSKTRPNPKDTLIWDDNRRAWTLTTEHNGSAYFHVFALDPRNLPTTIDVIKAAVAAVSSGQQDVDLNPYTISSVSTDPDGATVITYRHQSDDEEPRLVKLSVSRIEHIALPVLPLVVTGNKFPGVRHSGVAGVTWYAKSESWRADWGVDDNVHCQYFSAPKLGDAEALRLATEKRNRMASIPREPERKRIRSDRYNLRSREPLQG